MNILLLNGGKHFGHSAGRDLCKIPFSPTAEI